MDYDVGEAFQRIEDEMIASMSRNLKRHLSKEKEEGLNYSMWQAEQLKALNEFKKNNAEAFKNYFGIVNEQFGEILEKCNQSGQLEQEAKILEAIQEGWDAPSVSTKGIQGSFFKINERKMNALINATKKDMAKAETAMLRQANDVYRKTIFNAQVYYNSGAGTLSQCVDMATKDFLAKGITCVEYANGAMVGIDSYARMVLRTTQTRAYLMGEAVKRDEWGINTVIVNKRGAACPFCMQWVGQVYYDDVWGNVPVPSPEKYKRLSVAIKGGLYHPNCRDMHSTYFEGISTPPTPTTKAQIDEANRVYRLEQRQRYNERQIRKYKRLVAGSIDDENVIKYSQKLSQWQELQKNFIEENGDVLKRRAELEKVFELPENLQWGQNNYDFSQDINDIIKQTTKQKTKAFKEITDAIDFAYGDYTKEDYIKWMDAYDEHNKNVRLSDEELKLIDDYTEGSYIAFNDVSRYSDAELLKKGYTADDIKRLRKKAEMLEDALSKYDLDTNIVTHRFERDVTWLTGNGNGIDELKKQIGKEYTAKGFTSSGMLPNRFRFTGGQTDAVHFEIVTPKGTNGAFLSMSRKGENEFLYNRNTKFKVLDGGERTVKEHKFNFKTMQMEEIDVKERFLKVQVIPDEAADVAEEVVEAKAEKIRYSADVFPDAFRKTKQGKAAAQVLADTLSDADKLNPDIAKLYSNIEGLPDLPAPYKVSYTAKDHALRVVQDGITGANIEYQLKLPKMIGDNLNGEKGTAFHELAHFIDRKANGTGSMYSRTSQKLTTVFQNADDSMSDEIKKLFDGFKAEFDVINDEVSKKYNAYRSTLIEDYRSRKVSYKDYNKLWNASRRDEDAEVNYLARNLLGGGVTELSDIYDALSAGRQYDAGNLISGHGGMYYLRIDRRNAETFANYMSLSVNRPDLVEMLRKDKPELCKALDELIEEMAGKIQ